MHIRIRPMAALGFYLSIFGLAAMSKAAIGEANALEGFAWYSDCRQQGEIWGDGTDVMVTFDDGLLSYTISDFADMRCKEPLISLTSQGRFQAPLQAGVGPIDYCGEKLLVTIDAATILTMFEPACGRGFFKLGEQREVTADDCNGAFTIKYAEATSCYYSQVYLEADSLFLATPSSEFDGTTPERRSVGRGASFPFKLAL